MTSAGGTAFPRVIAKPPYPSVIARPRRGRGNLKQHAKIPTPVCHRLGMTGFVYCARPFLPVGAAAPGGPQDTETVRLSVGASGGCDPNPPCPPFSKGGQEERKHSRYSKAPFRKGSCHAINGVPTEAELLWGKEEQRSARAVAPGAAASLSAACDDATEGSIIIRRRHRILPRRCAAPHTPCHCEAPQGPWQSPARAQDSHAGVPPARNDRVSRLRAPSFCP